ncbi:amidophosphoribosyltransferase [Candidatus Woesebacteria bacterium]|nr:amidophosphoribosyltransferase [Candidatus Woesebacteria bacterium]
MGEKCGIFGVFGKGLEAARLVYFGLWSLQHRGQESSGIASSDGRRIHIHKGEGLVAHVYNDANLRSLPGHSAIGHNRYSTSKGSNPLHSQPVLKKRGLLALAHNGNLPSMRKLEGFLKGVKINTSLLNDSGMMHEALSYYLKRGYDLEDAVRECFPLFTGVFSLLLMTKDKMVAVRDQFGIRPLCLGQLNGGYVISSETCALDTVGATFLREIRPGEMVTLTPNGKTSRQLRKSNQKLDIFEFVYFARPDSILLGKRVNEVRRNLGFNLAREHPIKADVVIPVPDSAIPAALGYAEQSGTRFDHGLIKNRYIHRTFIRPGRRLREFDVELKLNPIENVIKGKRVVVIDDSIVRGTTSKRLVDIIRKAGAKRVHLCVSSPPVRFPDFYGINTPNQKDLIAAGMQIKDIPKYVGADSVNYLSYKGMLRSTGLPENVFSTSCFTGVYPADIMERQTEISYNLAGSQTCDITYAPAITM